MRRCSRINGRKPTLGEMARLSCLERLFVVLFALIVFSALPGVAPLVASYGNLGPDPDPALSGRAHLASAIPTYPAPQDDRASTPTSPGQLLIAAYWRNLSLVVAYEFDSDALLAPAMEATRAAYDAAVSSAFRFAPLGVPTSSYDAQAPPIA